MNGKHIVSSLTLTGLALLVLVVGGFAEDGNGDGPRLKISFAERFRIETWDNAVNLDDGSSEAFTYTRTKTSLGLTWRAAEGWEISGKLTNEFRVYLSPKDRAFNGHEVFFDNLTVKWRLPVGAPLTLTAGRQDIFLGEGFVLADAIFHRWHRGENHFDWTVGAMG